LQTELKEEQRNVDRLAIICIHLRLNYILLNTRHMTMVLSYIDTSNYCPVCIHRLFWSPPSLPPQSPIEVHFLKTYLGIYQKTKTETVAPFSNTDRQ